LSLGARPDPIFGGNTKEAAIAKNGGGTRVLPQSFASKDIEREGDERGGGGARAAEEDACGNHGPSGSAKLKDVRVAGAKSY
jgi:hypothetical protein